MLPHHLLFVPLRPPCKYILPRHKSSLIYALGLCALTGLSSKLSAQLIYQESFRYDTAAGWEFRQDSTSPGAHLTANAVPHSSDPENGTSTIDNLGNGWLRLATTTGNQSNAVALDTSFAAKGATITVAFDFAFWKPGTAPADGITAFFWDASKEFTAGAYGGSLGYANGHDLDGIPGGYVGVGLDVYGNYSNPTEGRNGGAGFIPGQVAVRGPGNGQDGYEFLAGTGSGGIDSLTDIFGANFRMDFINSDRRPDQDAEQYRRFEMTLDENNVLTVRMQNGYYGEMVELFSIVIPGERPDQLRFGFAGSTGDLVEVYEIRNLEIRVQGGLNAYYWDNEANNTLWNSGLNWDQDAVPTAHSHVYMTDRFPGTQTPQTVNVNEAVTLNSITFNGATAYNLIGANTINMDTDGHGTSYINVLASPHGDADHTINVNITLHNDLHVQNLVSKTLTLNGNLSTGSHALNFGTASGGVIQMSGVLSGSGNVAVNGYGTTVFSGNNTYTGATTVKSGILQIAHSNALGSTASGTTVQSGGTLALAGGHSFAAEALSLSGFGSNGQGALFNQQGNNTWNGNITLASNAAIGAASGSAMTVAGNISGGTAGYDLSLRPQENATITVSGVVSDTMSSGTILSHDGAGKTVLTNANTYTGATIINRGILQANANGALGSNTPQVVVNSGGTLALGGSNFNYSSKPLVLNGYGADGYAAFWNAENNHTWNGSITLGSDASIGAASGILTLQNGISTGNGHDLHIVGNGVVQLGSNINTVGNVFIDSGTLRTSAANQIGDSSTVTVANGATYDTRAGADTIGALAGGGTVQLSTTSSSAHLTFGGNNTDTTFSGTITGTSGLTKTGTGTTTFSGNNTFTGRLQINSGTVALGANNVFANNMGLTLNGGTFATNGYSDTLGQLTRSAASTLDFSAIPGSILSFSSMTGSATLTVENWIGSLSGGGDSQFLVTSSGAPSNLGNINFLGWGTGAVLVGSSGNYEIVPSLSGFSEWSAGHASQKNRWDLAQNWVGGIPNASGAKALIADLDANLNGRTISLNGNRTVGTLVIANTNGAAFTIANNTLTFNNGGSQAFLTLIGDSAPTISSNITLSSNTLISQNSTSTNGLTLSGATIQLNGNSLSITGKGNTTISGRVRGNGNIQKDGEGVLLLTASNNDYSGGTTLRNGTIQIGSAQALGSGAFNINGGIVQAYGANRSIGNAYNINNSYTVSGSNDLTFSGTGTVNSGNHRVTIEGITYTLSGSVGGSGGLIVDGNGTLVFSGVNKTFSGGLTIDGGTVSATRSGNITLGALDSNNNVAGTGSITVNSGGTFNLTQSGNNAITLRGGSSLTNNGGTINITSTGNNENRDFFIGTGAANTGHLISTGGITHISVGDDIRLRANSSISVSGGTVNLAPADAFYTEGTSNNSARIDVSESGTLNIDISGTRSDNNQITIGQYDALTVSGQNAQANFIGQSNSTVNLNGHITLADQGTLTVQNGNTSLSSTAIFDGGTASDKGTLVLNNSNLTISNATFIANAPNVTFELSAGQSRTLNGATANTNIENLGTLTVNGAGNSTLTFGSNVNNVQAQNIVINGGTLMLSASNQIENDTPMELAGGTWNTAGHSEVLGTLTLSANSYLDLASGASVIHFADSSSQTWDDNSVLIIQNWSGSQSGGGTDQVIFGNNNQSLSSSQLGKIYFHNPLGFDPGYYAAMILANGEIVPVPEPSTWLAGGALLSLILWFERKRFASWMKQWKR